MTTALTSGATAAVNTRGNGMARPVWLAVAALALVAAAVASVALGARWVGLADIGAGLTGASDTVASAAVHARIPRTVLALLVGAALGLSGAVMQAATRNPLADPAILGVSSGAALAVVIGMTTYSLASPAASVWVAIGGAALAWAFVWTIASLGRGGATPLKLTLAGAATAAALSSLLSVLLLPRLDVMERFRFWQIGGVGGAQWTAIGQVLPFLVLGAAACLACARPLNSLALGDEMAAGLGEHVTRTRVIAALGSVTLCGAATAVAGPIGFVGLVVPHVCRLLWGSDQRWVLPASALVGATLLTTADVLGRVVARPGEIDVGIITALVGAPVFIHIVRRQKVRSL